ncbi:hypothetical protein DOQ08_02547 [Marinobacter litoralis]|uniref:Uncharacterized protein n=1 Tax=Marinobacter litoralis TaxID=187981 RepID=A0A3M2RCS6_9GAMM|nr:hypothetical protein [Marinobacter litoralis]RMJ03082.1 hypothetical protein DOQ08_02547 [Marinobacter litoralis]
MGYITENYVTEPAAVVLSSVCQESFSQPIVRGEAGIRFVNVDHTIGKLVLPVIQSQGIGQQFIL